jgi:hypothetical protein
VVVTDKRMEPAEHKKFVQPKSTKLGRRGSRPPSSLRRLSCHSQELLRCHIARTAAPGPGFFVMFRHEAVLRVVDSITELLRSTPAAWRSAARMAASARPAMRWRHGHCVFNDAGVGRDSGMALRRWPSCRTIGWPPAPWPTQRAHGDAHSNTMASSAM